MGKTVCCLIDQNVIILMEVYVKEKYTINKYEDNINLSSIIYQQCT